MSRSTHQSIKIMFNKIKLLSLLAFMGLLIVSCSKTEVLPESDAVLVAKVNDGRIDMQLSDAQIFALFESDFATPDDMEEWNLMASGSYYYLTAAGFEKETGKHITVAIQTQQNGSELTLDPVSSLNTAQNLQAAQVKHKCTGDGCNCCGFLTNNGQIYGCECRNRLPGCTGGNSNCNHSIEAAMVVGG